MGQCVSSGGGDSTTATNANSSQPEPRCQAPGCQRSNDPTSSSRYCAQHAALCRRQGCTRPRYRKGPYCQEHLYTCRVSKCSNDQAKVIDAWFTNNSCLEHQPEDVLRAYFYGDAAEPDLLSSGAQQQQQVNNNNHRQRARRRRSRPKSKPIPVPAAAPSDERSSDSDDENDATAHRLSTVLSTIGEDAAAGDVDPLRPSIMKLAEDPRDADEPTTPRRSQKTVHFADSPPRPSTAEKRPVVAEVWWTTEPPANGQPQPPPSHRLRTSRNRRSLDGRRQSPRTSSSAVTVAGHGRERRYHPGGGGGSGNNSSSSSKAADGKRTTRTRSNR
ncbi:hypothetical protein CkaCkLH20_01843 [Colletotrichum karsti]|uniref:Uncharacterized protein n=1 Tax=Colletotrichum karsti TaxID=1095194 RepID=A0A9P6LPT7_9PEZI|nr:uncharacterized protein CkaCkLH20_01843 [Colletotrichum karsti]KAF9880801.1 hypothetical protein CkaCkLH20_01843 [Colletotrichum karsti]